MIRLVLFLLLLASAAQAQLQVQGVVGATPLPVTLTNTTLFNTTSTCAAITTSTACLPPAGAGLSYYISGILLTSTTNTSFTISTSATSTTCTSTPSVILGATYVASYGGGPIPLLDPIKTNANVYVCCQPVPATAASCVLTGSTKP